MFSPFGGVGPSVSICYHAMLRIFAGRRLYLCALELSPTRLGRPGWLGRTALDDCQTQEWTLLVLHDIDTGAMKQLDGFIQRLLAQRIEISQDFPPDCVPMHAGKVVLPMKQLC